MFSESVVCVREHKNGWKIHWLWEVDRRKMTWKIRWIGRVISIDRRQKKS